MAPADANKNIWLAAGDGDLERVKALIEEQGGDVNITDEEGDTPLYTAETVAVAQFLVEHGALVDVTNSEGVSPIETTEEDFPEEQTQAQEHEAASEELTAELIARTQEIITRAEREGRDPHDELTALVGRTVLGGMVWAGERDQEHQEENHDMPER
ncbi:ankyrin repeats [Rhizoctonia solani]|uniref:Ankyrin repeats n=1 Tax=Rhizoctonia solani TaxID=456999 RepID=A0A8H8NR92_9AGAM|nr:ankyrin repeats [Rhizoctonia solani]QRW18055.1 ankyrin repeats [Rhizoctonia solani]